MTETLTLATADKLKVLKISVNKNRQVLRATLARYTCSFSMCFNLSPNISILMETRAVFKFLKFRHYQQFSKNVNVYFLI